ncbi:PIN domain-containing protein [Nostocoides jenkinsii]|uniref:Uncharacterized protein n=1 Tax=Nostocoides jenkinsii Ben 74 TaxID=1193518 RepID=A0A077M6X9_9MICO|nr:PIN domain-containing protein [Tetrasphaera jenkinsii]CCI51545.1 conserved hypothetical protein [Tetrasphaera jenkinsii Ben 74]
MLDTCVLYSGMRRAFLLSMASRGIFRVVITEDVLFEIGYVEERKHLQRNVKAAEAKRRARHLVDSLRGAFPIEDDSRVQLIGQVGLPDPNDEHIVAAAIVGRAEVIVTENRMDFPQGVLPTGVRLSHPDEFVRDMASADFVRAAAALCEMSSRRQHPPQSASDIIDLMNIKGHLDGETANGLRAAVRARAT